MSERQSEGSFRAGASYLDVRYSPEHTPRGGYPGQLARHLLNTVYLRPGTLLDLGCGRGDYLEAFSQLGFDVVGMDVAARASELAPHFRVEVADLEQEPLPFAPESFDFLFSKSVIEHLREPSVVFAKVLEVLRPGGAAVFITPSWEHAYKTYFHYEYTHLTPFTPQSLTYALRMNGFENVDVRHFRQLPFLWERRYLAPLVGVVSKVPMRYRPYHDRPWPEPVNKLLRFSKEVMVLGVGRKPG